MGDDDTPSASRFWPSGVPRWARAVGMWGWMIAGTAAGLYAIGYVFSRATSIMTPLVVAVVIGIVAHPLVATLQKWKIPAWLGAVIVLLLLFVTVIAVGWITVAGVIGQWPEIAAGIQSGTTSLEQSLTALGAGSGNAQSIIDSIQTAVQGAATSSTSGILSAVGSGISGVVSLFFGLFIGSFLLYYVLSDLPTMASYVDSHLGVPKELGQGVVDDAAASLRGYFKGTTITGLAVAVVIGVGVALMGVPLAIPIALVTFLTCYIPFFGAIVSGAFAFLVAFGDGGFGVAVAVLVLVLVAQNLLQTVINAKVMGTSLDLHPLVVLVVTMLGGIFAGLLGAALAAPLLAMVLRASDRVRRYSPEQVHRK